MATYIQRNGSWFVQIRRKGHKSVSRTFDTKADAERWALQIEASMGIGRYVDTRETLNTSLADCLDRYEREVTADKKGAVRESQRIKYLLRDPLTARPVGAVRQVDIAAWRDAKIASGLSGGTVTKYLALISHVYTIAIKEWGMPLSNPVTQVRKPKANKSRDRRLLPGEEARLLAVCSDEMRAFVILAIETAMRRGELAGLRREWIKGRVARLPDTKNGTARSVPLSSRALEVIAGLPPRIDGFLFGLEADSYTRGFLRACADAGITGLVLHDLRHEATSRLFERGLDVMEVKSITGHKSLAMLSRYTHLRAEDLAKKLG